MALKKIPSGWQVFVYDPAIKRKRYVGTRAKKRDAEDLERETIREYKRAAKIAKGQAVPEPGTVREYADEWLELHHGEGTRRPAVTTRQVNEGNLRAFLTKFGDRPMIGDGAIGRREALKWAKESPHAAKSVSAMYNDAIDDEVATANPFANRRVKQQPERTLIHPLTEQEVDALAGIALKRWGVDGYGRVARAWTLFGAWVGTRPGETFKVTEDDVDADGGLVTVQRVKGRCQTSKVVIAQVVLDAIAAMPRIPNDAGLLFPTIEGKSMVKGALRYYWDPIRSTFHDRVTEERWQQLLEGQAERDLAFYSLRHFCASLIVDRGGNEYDVADQLGNTPEVCRRTYIHSYEERKQERLRGFLNRRVVVDLDSRRQRLGGNGG